MRTALLAAVAVGVVLRVVSVVVQGVPFSDGYQYMVLGHSLASAQGFSYPWGSTNGPPYGLTVSHHFAPLWPAVLALGYVVSGFSIATTQAMSFLVSVLLILVVFLTTRDLLGDEKAWIVTPVIALFYTFILVTGEDYSENLLTIFYVATIWAILRSLKDERYIVLAGLFAGIGYLSKAGVGYFFILAGVAGFLWRFYYMRWNVFRNRHYLAAIAIFLTIVGGWALRNILAFGWPHWQTSPYDDQTVAAALGQPLAFIPVFAAKIFLFVVFFVPTVAFFTPQLRSAVRRWKDEQVSAHLMAVALPALLGMIFATAYTLSPDQPYATLWWNDSLRYIVMTLVPLLWLAFRETPVPLVWDLSPRLASLRRSLHLSPRNVAYRLVLVAVAAFAFYEVDHMLGLIALVGALLGPRLSEIRALTTAPMRASVVAALIVVSGVASLNAATTVTQTPGVLAGQYLARVVRVGDVIGIMPGIDPYDMYPYLYADQVTWVAWSGRANGTAPQYALTLQPANHTGYVLDATFNWTKSPGVVNLAYNSLSAAVRSVLHAGEPSTAAPSVAPGEYFLYRFIS